MGQLDNDTHMDLEWFFNDAMGALGLESNFSVVVSIIESGGGEKTTSSSAGAEAKVEDTLDASDRYRRLSKVMNLLPVTTQRGLLNAFTRRKWPPELRRRPAAERYSACSSPSVRAFIQKLGAKRWSIQSAESWLARAESPPKDCPVPVAELVKLREEAWEEAEKALIELLDEYAVARTRVAVQDREDAERRVRRLREIAYMKVAS